MLKQSDTTTDRGFQGPPTHFLDRPIARVLAATVCLATLALLGYIHRDDLLPPKPTDAPAVASAFRSCFDARLATINQMAADSIATDAQITLFTARAEALCRAQNPE